MAKFRAAKGRKTTAGPATQGALPCLILLVLAFLITTIVLYYGLKGG